MDHNVHGAIVEGLRRRGIDCLTAIEDGAARAKDSRVLERATELRRVLFSQDTDMLMLASQWLEQSHHFHGVVYGGQLRITIGQAIFDLELIATSLEEHEMINRIEYLPL
jgi:predicted nuclease of predicted toxin-antitoxin system